jgi:hypothetical protein
VVSRLSARLAWVVALAMLCIGASGSTRPIDQLGWLVGGVWSADASSLGGGLERIDTRYEWTPNGSFIRLTTNFVTKGVATPRYAGDLFYDPSEGTLEVWYMDDSNSITHGPMKADGTKFTLSFSGPGDIVGVSGSVNYDVEILRTSPDSYQWTLFADVSNQQKKVFGLVYRRAANDVSSPPAQ